MPRDFTVIYTHPRGATATFIYQGGELSALAKGLDAEQFWVFKQVKALLLRNEEHDLRLASRMMADYGFTAQVSQPLPDLLAPIAPARPAIRRAEDRPVTFRPPPRGDFPTANGIAGQISEMHWREATPPSELPPHRAKPLPMPVATPESDETPIVAWKPTPIHQISEIRWRESHGQH